MAIFAKMAILTIIKMTIDMGKIGIYSISIKNVAALRKPEFNLMIFKRVMAKWNFWINFQ